MTLDPSSSAFVSFLRYRWLFNVATSFVNGPLPIWFESTKMKSLLNVPVALTLHSPTPYHLGNVRKRKFQFFNPSPSFLSIEKETPLQYPFLKALLSSGTTSNVIIQLIFGRTRYLFGKNKEKNKEIIKDTLLDMKDNLMTNKVMELRVEQLAYLWSLRPSSLPLLSTFCGNNSGIFW